MKRFTKALCTGVLSLAILTDCGSSSATSEQENESEQKDVSLGKNSFDFSQKTVKFNKEDNSLYLEYETGLPEGTFVKMFISPGHPDSWGVKYDPFYEMTKRVSQEVETIVEDGIISYTFDESSFNGYLFPNSQLYITLDVPITNEINDSIKEKIGTEQEFENEYPELAELEDTNTYAITENEDEYESISGYDVRFFDQHEMKNAYTIEEILAYYKKEAVSYKELEKNSAKYEGTPISFTGEVLQIQEEELEVTNINTEVRLAINGDINQVVYVTFQDAFGMEGIVNEDMISVYGTLSGSVTYESVAGHQITIPSMDAVIYKKN